MAVIKVIQNFESGDFDCIVCGKGFHLYYNGGELDQYECCGLTYRTEHTQTDLVILKGSDEDSKA